MRWEQQVQYASISDIGFRRRNNQDAYAVRLCTERGDWQERGHLFLVADGMGGHAVGELASKIAADTIPHTYQKLTTLKAPEALKAAVEAANHAIYDRGVQNRDFLRMGTTCTTLVLGPLGAMVGHVGDSRAYRVRKGRIDQLTFDHSLLWELMRQKKLRPDELPVRAPRNVITRSLGPEESVNVDLEGPLPILPGDTYVLCSDGLTGHVSDTEIGMIAGELPPGEACRLLIHLANLRGGLDNITVVIARVGPLPAGVEAGEFTQEDTPDGVTWWLLALFWMLAALFVGGLALALLQDRTLLGGTLAGASLLTAIGIVVWRILRAARLRSRRDPDRTVHWQPHSTAPARLTPEFLLELDRVESDVQRAANEEGWSIDWTVHQQAYESAQAACAAKQYSRALSEYARALDVLMTGVSMQRKLMQHEARRGTKRDNGTGRREEGVSRKD